MYFATAEEMQRIDDLAVKSGRVSTYRKAKFRPYKVDMFLDSGYT